MPRVRWSWARWPKSPPLMTSLTKNPQPPTKKYFQVETTRLAASFDTSTRSIIRTGVEIFPRKATCDPAVFLWTTWINPDVKVLIGRVSYSIKSRVIGQQRHVVVIYMCRMAWSNISLQNRLVRGTITKHFETKDTLRFLNIICYDEFDPKSTRMVLVKLSSLTY